MNHTIRTFGAVVLSCAAMAACSDTDDPTGIPDGESSFEVVLAPEGGASMASSALRALVADPLNARISLDGVASIILPIGRVEAQAAGGGWIHAGDVDDDIDLLALPAAGVTLVNSSLPEGTYTGLRFFLDGPATIVLENDVTVGRALFEAGAHTLVIPSSEQTGLKLTADFVVDDDGQVLTVLFDGDATVERVTATGSGVLMISPVLRVTDEDGDDVGEFDPDDDDDADIEFEGFVEAVLSSGFTLTDGTDVVIGADTRIGGDILTLAAVAAALAAGEIVEAEGEGVLDSDGETILATSVEFETDDDDGDGDPDDDDEEVEVEGQVTGVDRGEASFTVDDGGVSITVLVTTATTVDAEGDFADFVSMADAFDDGVSVRAEAEGMLDAQGRLVADEVSFETDD